NRSGELSRNRPRIYCFRCTERVTQPFSLGVGLFCIAWASMEVARASLEKFFEALRLAVCIHPLEHVRNGGRTQFQRPMHIAMVACDQQSEVPYLIGSPDTLAQTLHQLDAACLMADVP